MIDSYCKQCRDSGRVEHSGMIIPCPLCMDRKNANTTTVISKAKLAHLLAVEVAIKQLQATIAEMGNVIGNDQAQIKFYRDAVADKEDEVANALKTSADRWQIIEELMAEKVELNLTIAKLQSKDTVSKEELDRLTHK